MRLPALLALLCLPAIAAAQTTGPAPLPPPPQTILRLSETAEVMRAPNEIRATLRAEAREATAAAAQAAVNRAMTAALEQARAVQGITAATGGYQTWRVENQPARWEASQTLSLRGPDPAQMLELVGALQSRGLALGDISFTLTRDAARTAREEATSLAVDALRRRAEALAKQLGMQVSRLAEIQVNNADQGPRPMMAMARSAAAAPPPVAQASDIEVRATVEAVAVLLPPG